MSGTETLWQELICRLEGVQAAQVVFAENGMPCEIPRARRARKKFEIAGTRYPVCFDGAVRRTWWTTAFISVAQLSEGCMQHCP